nr:MAG TPA: hypothetical protein [Caudoviricetes sp.]
MLSPTAKVEINLEKTAIFSFAGFSSFKRLLRSLSLSAIY